MGDGIKETEHGIDSAMIESEIIAEIHRSHIVCGHGKPTSHRNDEQSGEQYERSGASDLHLQLSVRHGLAGVSPAFPLQGATWMHQFIYYKIYK